jgi:ABC-type amino acid transport system permease subunit
VGSATFSNNGLVKRLARIYVEVIRNIPLLLQLVFWYFVVFLALPNGIPSHDTISRVIGLLNPQHLHECFMGWVYQLTEQLEINVRSMSLVSMVKPLGAPTTERPR